MSDRIARLSLAIVAVEKFNRNAAHRVAEGAYAKVYRWAFGRLPDLSFGPAQVRISLLRQIAAESSKPPLRPDGSTTVREALPSWARLTDDELFEMLFQECYSLSVVAKFALHKLVGQPYATDPQIAAAYVGQRRRSNAPIDYASIVSSMATMLEEVEDPKVFKLAQTQVGQTLNPEERRGLAEAVKEAFAAGSGSRTIRTFSAPPSPGGRVQAAPTVVSATALGEPFRDPRDDSSCRSIELAARKREQTTTGTITYCKPQHSTTLLPVTVAP